MKKRIVALLLCCVMLLTLSPNLIATAAADDDAVPTVEETVTEPKAEEPKDETKTEEPTTPEQPKTEEPKAEEPKAEEPVVEEPKAEPETKVEEPVESEDEELLPEGSSLVEPIYITNGEYPAVSVGKIIGRETASPRKALRASALRTQAGGSGLELSKDVTYNAAKDSYTIKLEAYATGETTTTTTVNPVDIILMLDLSDYMYDTTTSYVKQYSSGEAELSDLFGKGAFYILDSGEYVQIQASSAKDNNSTVYQCIRLDTGSSIVRNPNANTRISYDLYKQSSTTGGSNKLDALKTAVNGFIANVHQTAPNSRIAIVPYAGTASVASGEGTATESALVTVDVTGAATLKNIVTNLTIQGGAANSHLAAANAVKIFQDVKGSAAERDRVAILFSAGVPGSGWYNSNKTSTTSGQTIAQATMTLTSVLKYERGKVLTPAGGNVDGGATWNDSKRALGLNNTNYAGCGATVYCVGLDIPSSGDPSVAYIGNEPYKSGALANEYFYRVSSHRPTGVHISNINSLPTDWQNAYANRYTGTNYGDLYYFYPDKLTRNQINGYYLTTDQENLDRLSDIFSGISTSIGTSVSTELGADTVIKDIISPQFTVPANAESITVYTAESDGSTTLWKDKVPYAANVTIDQTMRTISVTNFSFKDNWCGNEIKDGAVTGFHNGKKLIIEFTVKLQNGFLGGNNVVTNGANSGIYKDSMANEPLDVFTQPTVNVPIKDVTVTAQDKNVYLLGSVTADALKSGAAVKVGDVKLDLTKPNYGLETWQTEYVNITVTVKDKDGNVISDKLDNLTDDTTYTIAVTVSPKTSGTVTEKDGTGEANINVFKPELTFQDSEAYYGDDAPDYSANKVSEVWKHENTTSTGEGVTMLGTKPTLDITYTPGAGKIVAGKINTKQDIPVAVSVKIGDTDVNEHTTFVYQDCTDKTCTLPKGYHFWIHIKTCSLTITKTGGAENEPYVFTVMKDGEEYTEVTITGSGSVTIHELPVGTYTIQEDTDWSWRYTPEYSTDGAALSADSSIGTITCTNMLANNKWLNGFSAVVQNIFGVKH